MTPYGHTLAILFQMALGKAEMLGMTSGSGAAQQAVLPYDPVLRSKLVG